MHDLLPLTVRNLNIERAGHCLLDVPELHLHAGERVALVGPNGAGKSLLLRAVTGMVDGVAPGAVSWGTQAPGPAVLRRCGVVMQQPLMLRRSVRDNLALVIAQHTPAAMVAARVARALELCGLQAQATRSARVLSGGERMRLALARSLALEPELLLLDEPTASLDHSAARRVEQLIQSTADAGKTVFLISHDLAMVRRVCQRVVLMHRGRVISDASSAVFFDQPPDPQTAAFVRGDYLE
ncbi:MAG: ATP-binding cassette domain-containing protein [Pseudomonadota bacterium]